MKSWIKGGLVGVVGIVLFFLYSIVTTSLDSLMISLSQYIYMTLTGLILCSIVFFIIGAVIASIFTSRTRSELKGLFFGGFVGVLVFWYDYDFFFNFGGPSTPISDSIGSLLVSFGLRSGLFGPLIFLIVVLGLIGFIVGLIVRVIRDNKQISSQS